MTLRARTLDLLAEWTAIPSVAGDAPNLRRMAECITGRLRRLGAAILSDGIGEAPLVHARIDRGTGPWILLYNMYDVMPAPAPGWSVPPFAGGILDLPGLGPSYVGRGAENNKGPLAGMLVALEVLLGAGMPDANFEILIEGEEESGSRTLRQYLAAGSPVRPCQAALFPSFCEYGGGPPRVYLGTKGIAQGHIRVASGAWGGPSRAAHSSNAPWIANPAAALVTALAALPKAFPAAALPADARPVLAALAQAFDPAAELRFRNAQRYSIQGGPAAMLEAVLTATSFNLSSLATDPGGSSAVIPSAAEARFDLRTPPGIDPQTILDQLRAALPAGMATLHVRDCYPGHRFAPGHPAVGALIHTYRDAGLAPQIWPWAIGANPAHAFAAVAPCFLIGGLGQGGNSHAVDEFVTLDGLDRYLRSLLAWLPATARALAGDLP